VLELIYVDQKTQVVVTNHTKRFLFFFMTKNSKLNDFKFVTLMECFKNVKGNQLVP